MRDLVNFYVSPEKHEKLYYLYTNVTDLHKIR